MTTAPRTWVVGETVTAAMLNAEIRDQNNSIFGAWTAYTPTWTATTAPAIGSGTLTGRYLKVGRTVNCHIELVAGASTTYGAGGWSFGLPAAAAALGTGSRVGNAHALGSASYTGHNIVSPNATDTSPFFSSSATATNLTQADATHPLTWASGNALRMSFTYESAS